MPDQERKEEVGKPDFDWQLWTIHAGHVGPGPNRIDLIGCHIAKTSGPSGIHYEFRAPNNGILATTGGGSLPVLPFQFGEFFYGRPGTAQKAWFITVDFVNEREVQGTWSNVSFEPHLKPGGEPPDTWVAQAGSGAGSDEEDANAASASA